MFVKYKVSLVVFLPPHYQKTIFSTASSVIVFKSKQHLIPPLIHPLYHTQKMSILHLGTPWLTRSTCCFLLQTHFLQCVFFFFTYLASNWLSFLVLPQIYSTFPILKPFQIFPSSLNGQSPHPCLSNPLSSVLNPCFPPSNNLL